MEATPRHILSLSGGKDSSALAIYMRDRQPDMEYVFCDTGKELPETYAYLDAVEAYLGKPIVRLNADRDFDHWHKLFDGFLPSPQMRWCTKLLKLKPFEVYVGDDVVYSYIAIRADEDRTGYISKKSNLRPVFPFKADGIKRDDVFRILRNSGLGLPPYYEWGRSRSGCFFCFFQQKIEWVRLLQRHPDLYEEAMHYETMNAEAGTPFTWTQGETLAELARPERVREIEREATARAERLRKNRRPQTLVQLWGGEDIPEIDPADSCLVCHK
ncbi:MAG: phosphoadenosine phosphosulfate reductase family protein [Gemmatimonadetes bacterium]|jgi:3'-phosphoadenosine 5'-phosphosulfate sulfotransferase (PAPS reductase)/FAD synthetase|nr:phosphoadenosine phosphosulfate reductase family protein [Gemmatimonadota bacterium]